MTNANLAANPVTLIPSGPLLASTTITFPTNNTGGSPGFFAAQLITFLLGPGKCGLLTGKFHVNEDGEIEESFQMKC